MPQTYATYNPPVSLTPLMLTYTEASDLVTNNLVVKGKSYHITDASGTDLGVIVTGLTSNTFSLEGNAGFLNSDYQGLSGLSELSGVEDVTGVAPDGSINGVWQAANEGSYTLGNLVIWNGLHYQVVDIGAFDGTEPSINTTSYTLLPKSAPNVGYIEEWDAVEYDFANNWIQSREDKRGNKVKNSALDNDYADSSTWFQWGNNSVTSNNVEQDS